MLYERYLKIKYQRAALHKKIEQERWKQNAEIKIRDLIFYPDNARFSYGEVNHDSIYDEDSLTRLHDHIESLVKITNQYHEDAYCALAEDGTYKLKPNYKNTITRLSTAEFSLYGKKPLNPAEFAEVVDRLYQIAQNCHENVHLLLSSLPVLNENNEILNIALYVQAGKHPKIDTVTKGVASDFDVRYDDSENYAQQQVGELTKKVSHYMGGTKDGVGVISNNSVIEIETAGGARFTQFIDICLDHANLHSKRLFTQSLNAIDTTQFIPEQADHIVTSNSIDVYKEAAMTPVVVHVDPRPDQKSEHANQRMDKTLMIKNPQKLVNKAQYKQLEMRQYPGRLVVKNPSFGSDYYVKICKERSLEGFVPELSAAIYKTNDAIMQKRLDDMIATNLERQESKDFASINHANDKLIESATQLMHALRQSCKPNFFEEWFQIGNYQLKNNIQVLLKQSEQVLFDIASEKKDTIPFIIPWANDLLYQLSAFEEGIFSFYFLYSTKSSVKEFKADVEALMPYNITEW